MCVLQATMCILACREEEHRSLCQCPMPYANPCTEWSAAECLSSRIAAAEGAGAAMLHPGGSEPFSELQRGATLPSPGPCSAPRPWGPSCIPGSTCCRGTAIQFRSGHSTCLLWQLQWVNGSMVCAAREIFLHQDCHHVVTKLP